MSWEGESDPISKISVDVSLCWGVVCPLPAQHLAAVRGKRFHQLNKWKLLGSTAASGRKKCQEHLTANVPQGLSSGAECYSALSVIALGQSCVWEYHNLMRTWRVPVPRCDGDDGDSDWFHWTKGRLGWNHKNKSETACWVKAQSRGNLSWTPQMLNLSYFSWIYSASHTSVPRGGLSRADCPTRLQ